jgi:hypothetical protein
MSYDLVVWEGNRPASNPKAMQRFHQLYDDFMNRAEFAEPSVVIQNFVITLIGRWPDVGVTADAAKASPWVHPPLLNSASGPLLYLAIRSSRVADVVPYAVDLASENGLVCFDPQTGQLR